MGSAVRIRWGLATTALVAALAAGCGSSHPAASSATSSTTVGSAPASTSPTGDSPATATGAAATPTTGSTPTAAPVTATDGCLASQLEIHIGPSNGAAGSVGYSDAFQNISSSTCTLYGYPGLQMLDPTGQPIATDVIRGTSVTVPYVPERPVTLAPGARADFDMGFAASTGYGDAKCPTSTRVEFTAPNDFQSLTVALAIQPYGEPTIAQLHCGEVHVSPVFAPSSGG